MYTYFKTSSVQKYRHLPAGTAQVIKARRFISALLVFITNVIPHIKWMAFELFTDFPLYFRDFA